MSDSTEQLSLSESLEQPGTRDINVAGRRAVAFVVDSLIATVLSLLVAVPAVFALVALSPGSVDEILLAILLTVGVLVLSIGSYIGYYALLEGYLGQTLGKMLAGIEVILEDTGRTPGPKAAASRALLLMLADGQFFGAVGFASILATGKHQRLGDLVAGTLVVRRRSLRRRSR